MRFLALSFAFLATSLALECFVGKIPVGGINHKGGYTVIPKLTKCAKDEGCCVRDWEYPMSNGSEGILREKWLGQNSKKCPKFDVETDFRAWTAGFTYSCSSACPKFNGTAEVQEKPHPDALIAYCLKAEGACLYNCDESEDECA